MNPFDVRPRRGRAPGDQYSDSIDRDSAGDPEAFTGHPLDAPDARAEHNRLLQWFYLERERQAENRLEMAMDADFYDGLMWDPADAQALRDRGQMSTLR